VVRAVPPRERRIPAAGRLLKHDRRVAARLSRPPRPPRVCTCRWRVGPRACASRASPRGVLCLSRALGVPDRTAAGASRVPGSNHVTLTAALVAPLSCLSDWCVTVDPSQRPQIPRGRRHGRPADAIWCSWSCPIPQWPPPPLHPPQCRWRGITVTLCCVEVVVRVPAKARAYMTCTWGF
jgi:hypothetical protein